MAATRTRRRRRRLRRAAAIVALVVVAAAAAVVLTEFVAPGLVERARDLVTPSPEPSPSAGDPDVQHAIALVTVDTEPDGQAVNVTVLAYDREADQGTVLLVPLGTVAEVPGHGTFTVGDAYAFGAAPLLWVTVDNLLGARLDGAVTVSHDGWRELLGEVDGRDIADHLGPMVDGEREVERLPRARRVVDRLLEAVGADAGLLDGIAADGPLAPDTADPELVRQLFVDLADAHARDRATTLTLPVSPLGSGGEDLYRVDAAAVERLVDDRFARSRPEQLAGAGTRLQILNGVGVPGLGQEVAQQLRPGGYRVVLTGNADHFDYAETLIVVYENTADQVAVARDIRDLLGVGRIEQSTTPQTVVDVTIVVGADFTTD